MRTRNFYYVIHYRRKNRSNYRVNTYKLTVTRRTILHTQRALEVMERPEAMGAIAFVSVIAGLLFDEVEKPMDKLEEFLLHRRSNKMGNVLYIDTLLKRFGLETKWPKL